jgi:hypothetical protein
MANSLSIQRAFPVFYRGELISNLIPDLIVDDAVIVDPKVEITGATHPNPMLVRNRKKAARVPKRRTR